MAAKGPISVEEELRGLLIDEYERRHAFSVRLQALLSKREKELREQNTGGEDATMPDLVQRLKDVDANLTPLLKRCKQLTGAADVVTASETDDVDQTPLLQQCQQLTIEHVNKREKGASAQQGAEGDRDSGYSASADMGARKRFAAVVPPNVVEEAFPEVANDNDDSFGGHVDENSVVGPAQERRGSRDPIEHTDDSSPDSGSSRSSPLSSPEEETHRL